MKSSSVQLCLLTLTAFNFLQMGLPCMHAVMAALIAQAFRPACDTSEGHCLNRVAIIHTHTNPHRRLPCGVQCFIFLIIERGGERMMKDSVHIWGEEIYIGNFCVLHWALFNLELV